MIVIDASALAAYLLREEGFEEIREYLRRGVISVGLALKEVSNAVLTAWRRGRISTEHAEAALKALFILLGANVVVESYAQDRLLAEAFGIAMRHRITIYDALYIALAKERRASLLTRDGRQRDAAERDGVSVIYL